MGKQSTWTGERLETGIFNETTIEHLHRYALALELAEGKKVLDIACGEGYGSNLLAQKAKQVTGVDIDIDTIGRARNKYTAANLSFQQGSTIRIPAADRQFDMVVSFETLEHVEEQEQMISEIKRVLAPAGLLLISTPDKKNYSDATGYRNPFHIKELYADEFKRLLHQQFRHVQLLYQQMNFSSVITTEQETPVKLFTGDFQAVRRDSAANALYLLAIASDEELLPLPNSIFNGRSVFEQAVLDREKMVTGTITYRLGHALLYPFKLVKKILKR